MLVTFFVDVFAEAVQLIITIQVQTHFTGVEAILDRADATELAALAEILAVLDEHKFLDIADSEIVVEFKLLFF